MPDPVSALPADAVLVHIGPHKTGTTAIQSTLATSRDKLRAHGVDYPGRPEDAHHAPQVRALRQFAAGWERDPAKIPDQKLWTQLVEQVRSNPGRVVISSEFLAQADETARPRVVEDLGRDRLHILAAARNPAAIAISTWQQVLRKGYPVSLEQWLDRFYRRDEAVPNPEGFWQWADPVALSTVWARLLGPDRVTVVILDENDRRLLPTTFEQLLDLPAGLLADQSAPDPNRGLSEVEATLLREVVRRLGSHLSWAEYSKVMRGGLTRRLMEVRKPGPDEPKTALPLWAAEQAAVEAERTIAGLPASGVRVVGRLDSLRSVPPSAADSPPITEIPVDLAAEAVIGVIAATQRGSWRLDGVDRRRRKPPPRKVAAPKPPKPTVRPVEAVPTGELARILARRLRARLRRRTAT